MTHVGVVSAIFDALVVSSTCTESGGGASLQMWTMWTTACRIISVLLARQQCCIDTIGLQKSSINTTGSFLRSHSVFFNQVIVSKNVQLLTCVLGSNIIRFPLSKRLLHPPGKPFKKRARSTDVLAFARIPHKNIVFVSVSAPTKTPKKATQLYI